MIFIRRSALKVTYELANWPSADEARHEYVVGTGIGRPRGVYAALKGSTSGMDWPKGRADAPLDYPFGNTLITDEFGSYGIKSWSITAEPGHVPGILQVASYYNDNSDSSAPDFVDSYNLDVGAWDTGPLRVTTYDGSRYTLAYLRWFPVVLTSLI